MENSVTLFPSRYQGLQLTTTAGGSLVTQPNSPDVVPELIMSDSSRTRWSVTGDFGELDHGAVPTGLDNPTPALLNISGNMENFILFASKQTRITIGGDMDNSSFSGQNLHSSDVTSITV